MSDPISPKHKAPGLSRREDAGSAMKATTVRFSTDLWALLEAEAARTGVSVAQYVRDAALARAAFAAGARSGAPAALLNDWATAAFDAESSGAERRNAARRLATALPRLISRELVEEAVALRGQSAQAIRRATERQRRRADAP